MGRPVRALAALLLALWAVPGHCHDPGAWGGLFRSRDQGTTWVSVDRGPFLSGALALAISPTEHNHLLLGAEGGLFRSRNGGRDWTIETAPLLLGAVFAVAFAADGERALISTGSGIFRGERENAWQPAGAPEGAAPARAIVRGNRLGCFYLAGWAGLYRSDDWGASWANAADGLPQAPVTALLVAPGTPETLYAVIQGRIWASRNGAHSWKRFGMDGLPASIDAIALDTRQSARLWAAGGDGLFRSDDDGANWQRIGQALPEPGTTVNGITVSDEAIIATTDRGLYRSGDGGQNWSFGIDSLPAHLEAGPLLRDPVDPASLYAGFALIPYGEIWRRAASGGGALGRVSAGSVVGGVVFILVLAGGAVAAVRRLAPYYRPAGQMASKRRDLGGQQQEMRP